MAENVTEGIEGTAPTGKLRGHHAPSTAGGGTQGDLQHSPAQPGPAPDTNTTSPFSWQFFSIRSGKPRSLPVFSRIVPIVWF